MRPILARTARGILYFAAITAIVGWALPEKGPAELRTAPVTRIPEARTSDVTDMRSTPAPKTSKVRSKVNCAECGVIESMRTIDSREEIVGGRCATRVRVTTRYQIIVRMRDGPAHV